MMFPVDLRDDEHLINVYFEAVIFNAGAIVRYPKGGVDDAVFFGFELKSGYPWWLVINFQGQVPEGTADATLENPPLDAVRQQFLS